MAGRKRKDQGRSPTGPANVMVENDLAWRTDRPQAQAIVMPGGNWASLPVVERLESELGKPILVNNAVSLWAGLRLLKRHDSILGYGRLLRDHLAHELV